ncbi:hypothetical protein HQ585_17080 [candidate division KSB1 bacterium]|nr:hypothetical protein [candidate division KSB1 bacterium]
MKQRIIKISKLIFADARQAIVGAIVIGLVGGIGGLLYLSKTALDFSIAILNISTPLWAAISLAFLCSVYIYLKTLKKQSSSKNVLYTVKNLKWEVSINNDGNYHVSEIPYCLKHELKLILSTNYVAWNCPKLLECGTKIDNSNKYNLYQVALSHIEKAIRDKEIKC